MDELGLTSGDVIQIIGKKKTTALSWPGYESDHGKGTIRIDGYLRNNAGVSIDDKVTIRKIEAKIAQRVTLAPTEPLRIVGGEEYLSQILEGRVLARGDYVPISVMGRKIDLVVTSTTPTARKPSSSRIRRRSLSANKSKRHLERSRGSRTRTSVVYGPLSRKFAR